MKKTSTRETYDVEQMTKLVKADLKEFEISERVIEIILKSYFGVKRRVIMEGSMVRERGYATSGIIVRRVPLTFSDTGYTVKVNVWMEDHVKDGIMKDLENSSTLQDRLGFSPDDPR